MGKFSLWSLIVIKVFLKGFLNVISKFIFLFCFGLLINCDRCVMVVIVAFSVVGCDTFLQ